MNAPATELPLAIARDHPAFEGHFPGRPILPGVALLAEVFESLARHEGFDPSAFTLASAKFLRPVAPGEALVLRYERSTAGAIRFVVLGEDATAVASGALTPRPARDAA